MAATVSQHYIALGSSASSITKTSVVVGSGEGLVVLVTASDATSPAPTITGVTWNGAALTEFANEAATGDGSGADHRHAAYYLAAPTPGTQSIVASFGSSVLLSAIEVFVVAGHQASPMLRDHVSAVGAATAPTVTVTSEADDLCLDLSRTRTNPQSTAGTGQTALDTASAGNWHYAASSETATTTSTVMSWPVASDSAWNTQAVSVIAGTGGGSSTTPQIQHYRAQL